MSIPVSSVVSVNIAVGAQFPQRAGFGTLNIVTNETGVIGPAERIRSYSNIEGVEADWPSNSEVVAAASAYFSQNPRPTGLKVSVRFEEDQPAQLRGGSVPNTQENVVSLATVSDGEFAITMDGTSEDITGVDLVGAESMDQIAGILQSALRDGTSGAFANATCVYNGGRFLISTGTDGGSATIGFGREVNEGTGTDLSSLLALRQGVATKTDGISAESLTESLSAISDRDDQWYGLAFTKEVRDSVDVGGEGIVDVAIWIEARTKVFFNITNDLDTLDAVTDSDISSVLASMNLKRTITSFGSNPDQYPGVSIAGRAFTVNFSQPNSTITLKFKQGPGISSESLSVSEKAALDSKNANAFTLIGASVMYGEGVTADGTFFDEVHGLDWLQDAIQTNLFGYLLTRTTKVPYTDKGTAALQQQLIRALDEAVANGLAAPGETIEGEFLPTGYSTQVVPVASVNQSEKEGRQYGGLTFKLLGAGAIHGVQVNGTFER